MKLQCVIVVTCVWGASVLWENTSALKAGGTNVCSYEQSVLKSHIIKEDSKCSLFGCDTAYRIKQNTETVVHQKCCENWYPDPDNVHCTVAICNQRRGPEAGTCLNNGTCVAPDRCECTSPVGFSEHDCSDIDECASYKGGCRHACENTVGSYVCTCPPGFGLINRIACAPICNGYDPPGRCPNRGKCIEPNKCRCDEGFEGPNCDDVDECQNETKKCDQICENYPGWFECSCQSGYQLVGEHSCKPICFGELDGCLNKGVCTAPDTCDCPPGFGQPKCEDVNECEKDNGGCDQICENIPGNYTCRCEEGLYISPESERNGTCEPKCFGVIGKCLHGHKCVLTDVCECTDGYSPPHCEDIDECGISIDECEQICQNSFGGYTCDCMAGYQLGADNQSCTPQCFGLEPGKCPNGGSCLRPDHCACLPGYTGPDCKDIDECETESSGQAPCEQKCVNMPGTYRCECRQGFRQVQESKCHDVDECETDDKEVCDHACVNTLGSFHCACHDGFAEDQDKKCQAVCVESVPPGECLNGGTCVTPGVCRCPDGFQGDTCADWSFCSKDNGGCSHKCIDFEGGVQCACPEGYELFNEKVCKDVDECKGQNVCQQKCMNNDGSYTCGCHEGYLLTDGRACTDINECDNNVCKQDCENTPGSYVCKCGENFVANLDGECIAVKLCDAGDDPELVGCAPLCTGRRKCRCEVHQQLHTNGRHCIDRCYIKPCKHDGTCLSGWDSGYTCDCYNTGYTGLHCEKGVIRMPPQLSVRAGMTYPNIHINAKPDKGLKLTLSNSNAPVQISPNPVVVDQTSSQFNLLVSERGRYNLTFDISGASAGDFPDKHSVFVEANDVFSRLKLRNRALPSGCFWYQLKFHQYRLWFASTSAWYRVKAKRDTAPVVFTKGVVMLVNGPLQLPMSSEGVEITADSEIKLNAVKSSINDAIQLGNHKSGNCTEMFLSERDMVEFRESRSIFWTFFKNLEQIVPYYMQLSPVAEKAEKAIPFKPEILSGQSVQGLDVCVGAPTEDDKLYVVFRFQDPFIMSILKEKFFIKEGDFCIVVDMLTKEGSTVTFMFSDEAGARFRGLKLLKTLEWESYIMFSFIGISISFTGQLRLPPAAQELSFWNGARMFTYPFAKSAVIWSKMMMTRDVTKRAKYFDFKFKAKINAFLANMDPQNIFTHLFTRPRDVYIELDEFMLEIGVRIFGKRYSISAKDIVEKRDGVVAMGGRGERNFCGASANPPGAFIHVTLGNNILKGLPILENFVLGTDGQLLFSKTFPEGSDKARLTKSWMNETKLWLTKFTAAAEGIERNISSFQLPETVSTEIRSRFHLIKSHAANVTEHTSTIFDDGFSASSYADFTKAVTSHVYQLQKEFLDMQSLLSIELDSSLDEILGSLRPLISELRVVSGELVTLLYNRTLPFFPNKGTWGLKGHFSVTVFGLHIGIEGELIASDENVMPCQSRFSDFYEYLENDNALRFLGVVSWHTPILGSIQWASLFWRQFSPQYGFGIEFAFSMTRVRFVIRLHVRWSILGVKATGDLFVSTKGIFASVEGNLFDMFRIRLTVGAEYSLKPEEWGIWIQGDFLPGGDDTFTGSLWDAVRKAAKKFGESASARLKAGQRTMRLAQLTLALAQQKVEQAKAKVRSKEAAFDAAVAKLEEAKKKLEAAKAPFKSANEVLSETLRKIERMCKIRTCKSVCIRRLTWSNKCKLFGFIMYPCFQPNSCAFKIPELSCVAANAVCRIKRGLVYAAIKIAQAAVHVPMLILEGAKAAVSAAQIIVDKSRFLLKVAEGALDGTKLLLKGLQVAAWVAEKALAGLQKALRIGLQLLDAFVANTLQNFIDFKRCGFKNTLSVAVGLELELYCEVNLRRSGWKKHRFVINFKNIIGSLWNLAKSYLKKIMAGLKVSGRKRRDVHSEVRRTLHSIFRRNPQTQPTNITSDPEDEIFDTTEEFWGNKCTSYQLSFEFMFNSIQSLHNISEMVHAQAKEAELNSTAYFEEYNIQTYLRTMQQQHLSDGADILTEYGIKQDQVDTAIRNMRIQDEVVVSAYASSMSEVFQSEQESIREYENNHIIKLWKTEMENYTKETFEPEHDCSGFTDCLLFSVYQLKSLMDSVKSELVETAVLNFPKFDQQIQMLLENDTEIIDKITTISSRLLDELQIINATDIFCGTAPQMLQNPTDTSVVNGENATLSCLADGSPFPSFSWYKNGAEIPQRNTNVIYFSDSRLEDEGNYTCVAENILGQVFSSEAFLDVTFPPRFIGEWPDLVRLSTGQRRSLLCNVTADPEANILWYSSNSNVAISSDKMLLLHDLPENTVSLYKCTASNDFGQTVSPEVAVQMISLLASCPSVHVRVGYTSRSARIDEGLFDLISYPEDTRLEDMFKVSILSATNGSYSSLSTEFVNFDKESQSFEISISQPCDRQLTCIADDCEALYENTSTLVVSRLEKLIRVILEESGLFIQKSQTFHLTPESARVSQMTPICPEGTTPVSLGSCARQEDEILLDPPSDLKMETENHNMLFRWTAPDYADNFVTAYQLSVHSKVDGKTITANVSGGEALRLSETDYKSGEYEVTLTAFTQSHKSRSMSLAFAIGKNKTVSYEVTDTKNSMTVVAVGVTVALFILLIALAVVAKKIHSTKTSKITSMSSFASTTSRATRPSSCCPHETDQLRGQNVVRKTVPAPIAAW